MIPPRKKILGGALVLLTMTILDAGYYCYDYDVSNFLLLLILRSAGTGCDYSARHRKTSTYSLPVPLKKILDTLTLPISNLDADRYGCGVLDGDRLLLLLRLRKIGSRESSSSLEGAATLTAMPLAMILDDYDALTPLPLTILDAN